MSLKIFLQVTTVLKYLKKNFEFFSRFLKTRPYRDRFVLIVGALLENILVLVLRYFEKKTPQKIRACGGRGSLRSGGLRPRRAFAAFASLGSKTVAKKRAKARFLRYVLTKASTLAENAPARPPEKSKTPF